MKRLAKLIAFYLPALLFTSCDSSEPVRDEIEGTYYGTLTSGISGSQSTVGENSVAVIRKTGPREVEVHCYSNEFDTIFRLNYFEHEERFKVCATGPAFEMMYNMPYAQPMGMGPGMHAGSEWNYHLKTMHRPEDHHFGEFNTNDHSFRYLLVTKQNESDSNLQFIGYRDGN